MAVAEMVPLKIAKSKTIIKNQLFCSNFKFKKTKQLIKLNSIRHILILNLNEYNNLIWQNWHQILFAFRPRK